MSDVFFESSDRLLFVTFIILNERKFTLRDIIITCNTLDHSFLPLQKINKGISRLESEHFFIIEDNRGRLTKKSKEFYRNNKKKFKGIIDE